MSEHLVEIDLEDPAAIFAEPQGEARITEHELATLSRAELDLFRIELQRYVDEHPKLDVVTMLHKGATDELVIRWRWRR